MVKNHVGEVDFILGGILGDPGCNDFYWYADVIPGTPCEGKFELEGNLNLRSISQLTNNHFEDVYILCIHCEWLFFRLERALGYLEHQLLPRTHLPDTGGYCCPRGYAIFLLYGLLSWAWTMRLEISHKVGRRFGRSICTYHDHQKIGAPSGGRFANSSIRDRQIAVSCGNCCDEAHLGGRFKCYS